MRDVTDLHILPPHLTADVACFLAECLGCDGEVVCLVRCGHWGIRSGILPIAHRYIKDNHTIRRADDIGSFGPICKDSSTAGP